MLDNPRSPRVRAVAKLAKRKARTETGLFLVEGPQAVVEALRHRPERVIDIFATPSAVERHPDLAQAARAAGMDVEEASEMVLAVMADTVTPQGVIAVFAQFSTPLEELLASGPKLVAVLEEVQDPGNAGTIIRAADAAGADGVVLAGHSVDPYNPKVVRSTTGSLFHLPVVVGGELAEVLGALRGAGLQIVAADVKGDDLLEARQAGVLDAPTAWLFGNEARGLRDDLLQLADRALVVPIYGRAESMNLATAASVCLYESAFAQRLA